VSILRNHAPKALLLLLVLHFVAAPLSAEADFVWARYLVDGAYVVMLLAALNVGRGKFSFRDPMVTAVGLSIVLRPFALHFDTPAMWAVVESYSAVLMFYVAWVILKNVTKDRKVTSNTISGAAAVYILLAVAFASAHHAVALTGENEYTNVDISISVPHRDQTFQFYYYSVVSQTTLGYGDMTPKTSLARGLTMAQVVLGQLYLAVLLARLVAMELAQRRRAEWEEESEG